MATAVTSQKLASKFSIEAFDHDPGATTAVVTSADGGTTPVWRAMKDYEVFGVIAKPTIIGGTGLTLVEIVGATDSAGTNVTVVLAHAATAGDHLSDYVFAEVTDEQVNEVGKAAGYNFTHVAARLTMGTSTDEASVVYIRQGKRQYRNQTATLIN